MITAFSWAFPVESRAEATASWQASEQLLAGGEGDQLGADLEDGTVVFRDVQPAAARVMKRELAGGEAAEVAASVGSAGVALSAGRVYWQDVDGKVCYRELLSGAGSCIGGASAASLVASGSLALTGPDASGSTISLFNFETMRSKTLDSYSLPGMRYDPDIEASQAVWIKERGYAGKYFEPLIVSYDLVAGTASYLTQQGGGQSAAGGSMYSRRHPSLSQGRVVYQQRLNEPDGQWDIYEAAAGSFGLPLVAAPGDQINPSLSGNLLVYQDNRSGYFDDDGSWVDDWNIYLYDLERQVEQPLTTAPGDQVDPVIKGDAVVWRDNRGGDWDVYAAQLSAARPEIKLSVKGAKWASYADYLNRILTVRYRFNNSGAGAALQTAIRSIVVLPESVGFLDPLPMALANLDAAQSAEVDLRFQVPPGTSRFQTRIFLSCEDSAGLELWFPGPPPQV